MKPIRFLFLLCMTVFLIACSQGDTSHLEDIRTMQDVVDELKAHVDEHGVFRIRDLDDIPDDSHGLNSGAMLTREHYPNVLDEVLSVPVREKMNTFIDNYEPDYLHVMFPPVLETRGEIDLETGQPQTENIVLYVMKPMRTLADLESFGFQWIGRPGVPPTNMLQNTDLVDGEFSPLINPEALYNPTNGLDSNGFLYVDFFTRY